MKSNRGRPKKENARCKQYRLRLTEEEESILDYLSCESNLPKSEILRKGLKMQYNLKKFTD